MTASRTGPRTLLDKVWDAHLVKRVDGEPDLLYVDFHLLQEGSSPQAFEGLRQAHRKVRRPDLTLATEDHVVPTRSSTFPVADPVAMSLMSALRRNCADFGVPLHPLGTRRQGIVHVIGPQLGLTQPGMTVLCGDSHTSTHGAFGALAFGLGTSQVEHILATQTIQMAKPKSMSVTVHGDLPAGVTAKDLALGIIGKIGTSGAQGHLIEYRGQAFQDLSMEGRMTVCNMSIEAGARAGMIAPDEVTFAYLQGRDYAPTGDAWHRAVKRWSAFRTDPGAHFDTEVEIDAAELAPFVTWGTNPSQSVKVTGRVPHPNSFDSADSREAAQRAIDYMDLVPGTPMHDVKVDVVFLGSCTNGRIEDLRAAASILRRKRVADHVSMIVVPGSTEVKLQAEREGLDKIFLSAGAQWRGSGCSLCVAMNDDSVADGQRCASTTNRNFEGRQGRGARTHLVSPAVAAATAVVGRFADPSQLEAS